MDKQKIQFLGLPEEMECRVLHSRIDDQERQRKVQQARDLIYISGRTVDSVHVEHLLREQSLVPVIVSRVLF